MLGALFTRVNVTFACLACVGTLSAQVPQTDLFLFSLVRNDTSWTVHSPRYLSAFNEGGYTNQPEFITDDLLYVSVRMPGEEQNDIYGLDIRSNTIERVTQTPEGEYSPTLCPDGTSFSCVRQNDTDTVDQRLYQYPLDRSASGTDLVRRVHDVGYFSWLNSSTVALFQVTDPPTLAWVNLTTGDISRVLSNVGRCLRTTSTGQLAFVHKYDADVWYLKTMSSPSQGSKILIETPDGSEDFAITKDGTFFIGNGSQLMSFNVNEGRSWKLVADLSVYGIERITRLDINDRNEIAVVSAPR